MLGLDMSAYSYLSPDLHYKSQGTWASPMWPGGAAGGGEVIRVGVVVIVAGIAAATITGCFLCASCCSEFLIDPKAFNLCNNTAGWVLLLSTLRTDKTKETERLSNMPRMHSQQMVELGM